MTQLKYNFDKDVITLGDAINLIIQAVYSEEASLKDVRLKVEKRVRFRISDAVEKGSLRTIRKGTVLKKELTIDAPEFFEWAVRIWPLKSKIDNLPVNYSVNATISTVIKKAKLTASAVVISGDSEKLERSYIDAESERLRLEKENQSIKAVLREAESRLVECEKELNHDKKRKARINKKKGRRTI